MDRMTIAFASDHGGFLLKNQLVAYLEAHGYAVLDLGTDGDASVDYPDYAAKAVNALKGGQADLAVLLCGTGIGISIAANKHAGIRAALCHDVTTARLARAHNDANVIAFGGRVIGFEVAKDCLDAFLSTDYEGGRHARRVAKIDSAAAQPAGVSE